MKVKLVNPEHALGLIDPQNLRAPFIDPETKRVVMTADVPESSFWVRRVISGELVRVGDPPVVLAPITPLSTR